MLSKTITYTDYDGVQRTETHYFNLNKAEITKMELSEAGGLQTRLRKIIDAKNVPEILSMFEEIIEMSYGVKSPDGRRLMKSPELFREFKETEAYSDLFMEITKDSEAAAVFVNALLPPEYVKAAQEEAHKSESNVTPIPADFKVTDE